MWEFQKLTVGFSVCITPQDKGEMVKMFGRLFSVELTLSKGEIVALL